MTFALWLTLGGALLVIMALGGSMLSRMPVSTSMLYLLAGLAVGPLGAAVLLGGILAPTDPVLATEVQLDDPADRDRRPTPPTSSPPTPNTRRPT